MITDAAIRKAVKAGTFKRLTDPAPRGAGRLVAVVKPPLVEWYAQRITGPGRRQMTKLGTWPDMSIAAAREAFAGHKAKPVVTAAATFGAMCDGYLDSLRAAGKPSVAQASILLAKAGAVIGRDTLARDVTPADVVAVIRPVFERGARVQADKFRMYLGAAFRWAMQATHDYRVKDSVDWGVRANPVEAVPRDTEAEKVGERALTIAELVEVLQWARMGRGKAHKAVLLLALTGQRVREIVELRAEQWDSRERLLTWRRTKTGTPHSIPVPKEAAQLLDVLAARAGAAGWLFPGEGKGGGPLKDAAVLAAVKGYADWQRMPRFTGRDLRRTWKTLAAQAGLSKQERDRLQNHSAGDVSSRHYDRWEYLPEKRAAVARWEDWLHQQVREHRAKRRAKQVIQPEQDAQGERVPVR